jgi:predicted Zn finger-like uncharacterized protein
MILSCNSCEKKFVVPDEAITAAGRTVQCGACGNKWKQFPIKDEIKIIPSENKINNLKKSKSTTTKKRVKKTRRINLYSPEYLAKKHGITLNNIETKNDTTSKEKISFGFYNSLILFIVAVITLSKGLHFFQEFIIHKFPFTEFYLDYFFESIKNIFEILKNLVTSY